MRFGSLIVGLLWCFVLRWGCSVGLVVDFALLKGFFLVFRCLIWLFVCVSGASVVVC